MPQTVIHPCLTFSGRCAEALEFYRTALGAETDLVMRFDESPTPPPSGTLQSGFERKIMHASFRIGGVTLMATDGCDDQTKISGMALALGLPTEAEDDQAFAALADGGTVTMPLGKTFWNPRFGMVTDRFGVAWLVSLAVAPPPL